VEEEVEPADTSSGEDGIYLARIYAQAPEVDGATVIESEKKLQPGTFVNVTITGTAGLDLNATVNHTALSHGSHIQA
jgi:hypothetical protein